MATHIRYAVKFHFKGLHQEGPLWIGHTWDVEDPAKARLFLRKQDAFNATCKGRHHTGGASDFEMVPVEVTTPE